MTEQFKLCILFEEKPGRDLSQIAAGWEMAEIPVGLMVKPFESAANWSQQRQIISSWNLPPIKVASHFLQFWGLKPTGPGVDWAGFPALMILSACFYGLAQACTFVMPEPRATRYL